MTVRRFCLNRYARYIAIGLLYGLLVQLSACMSFSSSKTQTYQLTDFGKIAPLSKRTHISILVMQPAAEDGYDSLQMLYVSQPYQMTAFTLNSWISRPSTMIAPLLMRSIESSHYFYAVTQEPNMANADYRLDSVLLRLQQNFLVKPSQIQLALQVMLIHPSDDRLIATAMMSENIACPSDNPLGGVIAANQATRRLTARVAHFVVEQVAHDQTHLGTVQK